MTKILFVPNNSRDSEQLVNIADELISDSGNEIFAVSIDRYQKQNTEELLKTKKIPYKRIEEYETNNVLEIIDLIKPDIVIVTNDHVVENANEINITLADGRTYPSVSVATDPVSDLAIIKIDVTGLPAAKLGNSSSLPSKPRFIHFHFFLKEPFSLKNINNFFFQVILFR